MEKEEKTTKPQELPLDRVLSDILQESQNTDNGGTDTAEARDETTEFISERELAAMSPDERRQVYEKLTHMIDSRVQSEVERLGESYRRGIEKNEDSAVKAALSHSEKFNGFGENIVAIDGIIEKVPVLASLPAKEKYTLAYLIHEGIRATEQDAPSAEQIVKAFRARPDAMRMYDAERAEELARAYASVPAFAASRGAASMPATVRSSPKTLEEASREAYAMFGI